MGARAATRMAWPVALGICAVWLASCAASLSAGARDRFTRVVPCPLDQVTVVARPDQRPASSPGPSSVDEAADPGGVAYWQQTHDAPRAAAGVQAPDCEMFEAAGCGRRLSFCCHHPTARDSTGAESTLSGTVECEQQADGSPDAAAPPQRPAR